jgi:TRAP-type C4-dicarboxylate transport system permease small subunit
MTFRDLLKQIMQWSGKLSRVISAIAVGCAVAWVTFSVIMRYVFRRPFISAAEISGYLLITITFVGLAYALESGTHVRTDLLTTRVSKSGKKILEVITWTLGVVFSVLLVYSLWMDAGKNYRDNIESSTLLRMPMWIPGAVAAIGATIFGVYVVCYVAEVLIRKASQKNTRAEV